MRNTKGRSKKLPATAKCRVGAITRRAHHAVEFLTLVLFSFCREAETLHTAFFSIAQPQRRLREPPAASGSDSLFLPTPSPVNCDKLDVLRTSSCFSFHEKKRGFETAGHRWPSNR